MCLPSILRFTSQHISLSLLSCTTSSPPFLLFLSFFVTINFWPSTSLQHHTYTQTRPDASSSHHQHHLQYVCHSGLAHREQRRCYHRERSTVQAGPRGAIATTNAQDMPIAPRGNMDNHNKYADSPAGSDQEVDENKSLEVSDDFGC